MTTRYPMALLLLLLVWTPAAAQQTTGDAARQALADYQTALAQWQESGISTSLDDARTDAPFLDGYAPSSFAPLAEMPRCAGRGYLLVAPGAYEMDAASFCLQAGTYGPGGGDGYVLAPLEGQAADLVTRALENWTLHPELTQEEVQVLLWVLEARVSPDSLPERRAQIAALLLGDEGLAQARAMARGPEPVFPDFVPPELVAGADVDLGATETAGAALEQAMRDLEALTRRLEAGETPDPGEFAAAMERLAAAQAQSSQALEEALAPVTAQVARMEPLLTALEATFEEMAARAVPQGDPTPPEGSRSIPAGRWSYHPGGFFVRYLPEHFTRTRVEVVRPGVLTLLRDDSGRLVHLAGWPGRALRLRYAEGDGAATRLVGLEVTDAGGIWVTSPDVALELLDGEPGAGQDHQQEVQRLLGGRARHETVVDCLDLYRLVTALGPLAEDGDHVAAEAVKVAQETWMAAVCAGAGVRLALVPATSGLAATGAAAGDGLPWLNPGRDGLVPGNRGRQRLTTAPSMSPESMGKLALKHAVESCEILQTALAVVSGVTDPLGWLLEQFGLGSGGMPGMILGEMIQMMFDLGAQIAQALGGDPPRPDYELLDAPPALLLPEVGPANGAEGERRSVMLEAAGSLAAMVGHLQAAQIAMDRMGGANEAGEDEWVWRQATSYVYHKRAAAALMVETGERFEGLFRWLDEEGPAAPEVDLETIRQHQEHLSAEGWSETSREAMRRLGLDAAQMEVARQRAVERVLEDEPAGLVDLGLGATEALQELGRLWTALPQVEEPAAPPPSEVLTG